MKDIVKSILITSYLVLSKIFGLSKRLRNKNLTVLLYHEVSPEVFRTQTEYLSREYHFISLNEVKSFFTKPHYKLPSNALWVTFDDGWKSNYKLQSTIKEFEVKPTIFIPSDLVFTNRKIWNFTLDRSDEKGRKLNDHLKSIPNHEKDQYLKDLNGHFQEREYSTRDFITKYEYDEMKECIDFQAHSRFHPVLTMCDDERLEDELKGSRKALSALNGEECISIAYPYGIYNKRVMEFTEKTGYTLGRIANKPSLVEQDSDPFEIRSIDVRDSHSVNDLKRNIAWAELNTLLKLN